MTTDNFEAIKAEILKRAKENYACKGQYGRAYKSKNLAELMQVIKDNFHWAYRHDVVTPDIIEQFREDFATNDIYLNVDANHGFLLCDNATVTAYDNATVEAYGNAKVEACDNATVTAYDNAKVEAYDNAKVEAYDNAKVEAYGNAKVKAWDNATVTAWDNATVKAYDNATVEASDNAYCTSLYTIECKLSGNAIYRLRSESIIFYANDEIKFVKQ